MGRSFDDVARGYDLLNDVLSLGLHRYWRARMVSGLHLDQGCIALDVCTGTADSAIPLAKKYPGSRVVGIDVSRPMLMQARAKVHAKSIDGRCMLCQADGLVMPFADGSFDAVLNSFGLRNETVFAAALREMARVVKPGGVLRILEFSLPQNRLLRQAHVLYLGRVIPAVSRLFGAPAEAYEYLSRTIQSFLSRGQVVTLLRESGLADLRVEDLSGGIVCCYTGRKPAAGQGEL